MASRTVNSSRPTRFVKSGDDWASASPRLPAISAPPARFLRNSRRCRRLLLSMFIGNSSRVSTRCRPQVCQALPYFLFGSAQAHVFIVDVSANGVLLVAQERQRGPDGRVARSEGLVAAAVARPVLHDQMGDPLVVFLN